MRVKIAILSIVIASLAICKGRGENICEPDDIEILNEQTITHEYIPINEEERIMAFNSSVLWNQERSNMDSLFKITCLKNIKFQVVAGMLYTINATLSETICDKSKMFKLHTMNLDRCNLKNGGIVFECAFKYWTQIWMDNYSLLDAKCSRVIN